MPDWDLRVGGVERVMPSSRVLTMKTATIPRVGYGDALGDSTPSAAQGRSKRLTGLQ